MEKLRKIVSTLLRAFKVYKLLAKDSRVPRSPKIILAIALAYLLMPFDIITDFIPLLGQLDDVMIVVTLISIALKIIPKEIIKEHRNSVAVDQKS